MSVLPGSWSATTLGEICDRIVDGSHNPPREAKIGKPMLSAKNIRGRKIHFDSYRVIAQQDFLVEDRRTTVKTGDVLLTIVGAIGRAAVVPLETAPFTLQRSVAVLKPKAGVDSRYVAYAIEAPGAQRFLEDNAKGTAQKGVYLKTLASLPLAIAPSAEQVRIANKLDRLLVAVDTCKARLDAIPPILKRFRQSVLAAATSGELTREWRARNGVEGTWVVRPLGELTTKVGSGATPRGGEASYKTVGIPLIRSMNVVFFGFKYDNLAFLDEGQAYDLRNVEVKSADVLLNITGASIGRVTMAPPQMNGARVNQHVCIIRPREELQSDFLCWFLSAPRMQAAIGAENYGMTRQALTKQQILDFQVPVPPRPEQAEIARQVQGLLDLASTVEGRWRAALSHVEMLPHTVLAEAFSGKLVPQDPNDEPADQLLERMNAERSMRHATRSRTPRIGVSPQPTLHQTSSTAPTSGEDLVVKRNEGPTGIAKTLDDLLRIVDREGGEIMPDQLLMAAGLEDDPEAFFELLRQGRDGQVLKIPVGQLGSIQGSKHANR